jgi:methylated-DNA-[protein]-cysteine S-methyltransferase
MICNATFPSPIGPLVAVAEDGYLTGLYVSDRAPGTAGTCVDPEDDSVLGRLHEGLERYWQGEPVDFDIPLRPRGTTFQSRVWQALRDIPYGCTISYGELARRVGQPTAARAVGRANGANPISIVIPCHRVIGGKGTLIGYAGGLDRKKTLLLLERALADT